MTQVAYVVTEGSYSDYHIVRVYLDRDEAQRFVDAYNATMSRRYKFVCNEYDIEEWPIGGEPAEMDNPIWEGTWRYTQVEKPIPNSRLGWDGPGWREYFKPREYTGEWKDSFDVYETWYSGSALPKAEVTMTLGRGAGWPGSGLMATVRGTSKEHVEKALQDTAAQMKAEHAGIT